MSLSRIQTAILEVLREVQEMSGRVWRGLSADARPIGDLEGFDSLLGVEATVLVELKLDCRLDLNTVFVSGDGKVALSVREVAEQIQTHLEARRDSDGKHR